MQPGLLPRVRVAGGCEGVYGTFPGSREGQDLLRSIVIGKNPVRKRGWLRALALTLGVGLTVQGCSVYNEFFGGTPGVGQPGYVSGFLGGVAADEPTSVLIAKQVLGAGGNAADAATALGFALSVTLPSRAGLGGGGACLVYNPDRKSINGGVPEAIEFMPIALAQRPGRSDRPASVPMLARGLFALQARYGRLKFDSLVTPAEQLARFGTTVSRAFAADLAVVAQPLLADPNARAIFGPNGTVLAEGARLLQPDLAATISALRVAGVGDLYQGALARRLVEASPLAGGVLTMDELRGALPRQLPALELTSRNDVVSFLPPPADGGLAAAAAFGALQADPRNIDAAAAQATAAAVRWRTGSVANPMSLLGRAVPPAGELPLLPASTSFVTLDKDGGAVACAVTMDNLFGTGRIVPGTGILLAAAPNVAPPPLIAAAIAWNRNLHGFRAAVAGSGQNSAALAVAVGTLNALRSGLPMSAPVPDPGRANVIVCDRYLPGSDDTCRWATDPRGGGLAVGSN
jgi:gamma-glutamyltranspeptidase/glutathione hydrolase